VNLDGQVQGAIICISDMSELRSTVYEFSARNIETTFEDIHGISDTIRQLKVDAQRIAANDSTILILGESGTGKELFARAIHASSKRRGQPFIAVNCGAIPENLLESELFGYDEGAFSGARKGGKPGKFEMAGDGTLFLDEIAELPIHMQVKLLRVLQDGRIERVGSITSTPVNVRIIAATNRDLEALVKTGNFRNDLFYRLNVVPFVIPPLRSRSEDIPGLARFFKDKYNEKMNKALVDFTPQAMAIMIAYRWPGNVREVQNAVEYAVNFEAGNHIRPESLPKGIVQNSVGGAGGKFLANKLRVYEQSLIDDAILRFGNSVEGKKQAARELGISLPTLYRKMKEWGSE
jgi:transcriptional regulator with PAS, ATPase and Fis domain